MKSEGYSERDVIEFENYISEFGKNYDNDFTAKHRMEIFMQNKKKIEVTIVLACSFTPRHLTHTKALRNGE